MNDVLISRKAAIKAIDDLQNCYNGYSDTYDKAYIIGVLEELPSAEEMAFNEWCTDCKEYDHEKGCCPRFNRVIRETVEEVKEAHQEKRGRWVKLDMHPHLADHKCTACGESTYVPTCMGKPIYLFCPWCGARMEGEEDE